MATQVVDLTKLPFVKSLLASMTPGPDISQEFQHSGPNAALGDTVDMSQQPQSRIPKYLLPSEMGPPAPAPDMQQQDTLPPPDLSVGQPPPVPPQPANPVQDLTQSMVQDQTAPDLRTRMFTANAGAAPTPTKANKLLQILRAGIQGGLAGEAQNAQTYAQTGRNAGFGGGFYGSMQMPFQQAYQQGQLAQQGAQTKLLESQSQMVPTPYGNMPAAFAKLLFPALVRGQATTQAAQTRAGATTQAAQIGAESRQKVAQINQGQPIPVDQATAELAGMPEIAGTPVGRGTWTNINKALEAKGYRVQDMGQNGTDPNSGMWLMDRAGNRIKQVSPNSLTFQRGASFAQNRPEVVVDPNDPGYAYYTTAANAMRNNLPSPMGAAPLAAKTAARSEVPTKIGDQKVAFSTAMQHADLLKSALSALNNGNVQMLNSLQNKFGTEFGTTGPITAEAIADAYSREVQKGLSSGHITEGDTEKVKKSLNVTSQSIPQSIAVLDAYKNLFQSKMNMLANQEKAATAGRGPKSNNAAAGPTADDLLKKYPPKK